MLTAQDVICAESLSPLQMERAMQVLRTRLYHAIKLAVECQSKLEEEKLNYQHDSRFLSELRVLLAAIHRGERIDIVTHLGDGNADVQPDRHPPLPALRKGSGRDG
jgi:hypothetical protein